LGEKIRFSAYAASEGQVVAGVAMQLFTLGIPCIYYGTEQALAGPEDEERKWLPDWKASDRYLREAMFGPMHPRPGGVNSLDEQEDESMPGFGPFGTVGHHCFDPSFPIYRNIAAMAELRRAFPALRHGRQYLRQMALAEEGLEKFDFYGAGYEAGGRRLDGQIVAWSRILDDEEVLCLFNSHGSQNRSADVLVDAVLNRTNGMGSMTVVLNSAQAAIRPRRYSGAYRKGSKLMVKERDGMAYVEIRDLAASQVLVLASHPEKEEGAVV